MPNQISIRILVVCIYVPTELKNKLINKGFNEKSIIFNCVYNTSLKNVYWFETKVWQISWIGFSNELVTSSVLVEVEDRLLAMYTRVGQGWEGRVDVVYYSKQLLLLIHV